MQKSVLICTNYSDETKSIIKKFKKIRFDVKFYCKSEKILTRAIQTENYDNIIFIINSRFDELLKIIPAVQKKLPDENYIIICESNTGKISNSDCPAPNTTIINIPNTANFIFGRIVNCIYKGQNPFFIREVYDFLQDMKFPAEISGFFYTCSAVDICIKNPRIIDERDFCSIYKTIAKRYGVSKTSVERDIRHFCSVSFSSKYRSFCIEPLYKHPQKKAPTNKKIVKAIIRKTKTIPELYDAILNSPDIDKKD